MTQKIITGIKSTGVSLHLGNLMGAVLPFQKLATGKDAAIFVADLHSLTSVKDGQLLRKQTFEIAVEYFAIFGIDSQVRIFCQSDIHDITKLMWILTNVTPYSLMLRAHSFKDIDQEVRQLQEEMGYFKGYKQAVQEFIGTLTILSDQDYWENVKNETELNIQAYSSKLEELKEKQFV